MSEPTAPRIPSHEEQFREGATELDQHQSSENPHEGRFDGSDSECAGDCPDCDEPEVK
jgi:hypothetical protein